MLLMQAHSKASTFQKPTPGAWDRKSEPPLPAQLLRQCVGQAEPLRWLETGEMTVAGVSGGGQRKTLEGQPPLECASHWGDWPWGAPPRDWGAAEPGMTSSL